METNLKEPDFGVDDFNLSKYLRDEKALARTILMILFGKPGVFPSLPEVGMYIQDSLYEFEDNIDPTAIKIQIAYQCSLVGELIDEDELIVEKQVYNGKPVLLIVIPSIAEGQEKSLVLGIQVLDDGKIVYHDELIDNANIYL